MYFTLIFAAVFALPLGFSSAAVYLGPRYSLDADRLLNADRSEDGGVLYGRSKSKVARWWTHPDYCKEKRCDLLPPLRQDALPMRKFRSVTTMRIDAPTCQLL